MPSPGGVGGQQHLHLGVVEEALLRLAPLLATHAAVDQDHRLRATEQRADLALEIGERVPVLGENDELLPWRGNGLGDRPGTVGHGGLRDPAAEPGGREDLAEQVRQLAPLGVLAAAPDFRGQRLQARERGDLDRELGERGRRRGLVEDLLLGSLDLVLGGLVEILQIVVVERWSRHGRRRRGRTALQQRKLAQPLLQSLAAPAERLEDGLRRRGQPALQDGEREPDRAGALVVLERLGAVELAAHVLGHVAVEARLGVGELEGHGVGDALGEERAPVEPEQIFLHHAAHQVGHVDLVHAVAEAPLEAIAVEERHEELKVLLLAVVGCGGHQEEMPREPREELTQARARPSSIVMSAPASSSAVCSRMVAITRGPRRLGVMSCVRAWTTLGPLAPDTASNVPKSRSWVKTTYPCVRAQVMMTTSVALGFPTVDQ